MEFYDAVCMHERDGAKRACVYVIYMRYESAKLWNSILHLQ